MKLSEISISRPVLATVMSLGIVLLGLIALLRLPVREYPDVDPPIVSITTFYRGASPNVVETDITEVLEEQLATLEGVKTIESSSQEQGSVITVEFELSRDPDEATNDVRDRVSRSRGQLRPRPRSRSSPRSTSTRSPSSGSRCRATGIRPWSSPRSPTASSRNACSNSTPSNLIDV